MLKDGFGRRITSVRISVTDKCNLHCPYCHREGGGKGEMKTKEILRIIKLAVMLGMEKMKITGGEPLLRKDITEIIKEGKDVGFEEISLTTNGTLLKGMCFRLKEAGLDRVNISCDLPAFSGMKNLGRIFDAIKEAKDAGLEPVKLNMVVLKGVNDEMVWKMFGKTKEIGVILQLIELIPAGDRKFYERFFIKLDEIETKFRERASGIIWRNIHGKRQYYVDGGWVEIVRPTHNSEFCRNCNRLRITADGKLRPCLMRNESVDILGPMREGVDDGELLTLFEKAVEMRRPYWGIR